MRIASFFAAAAALLFFVAGLMAMERSWGFVDVDVIIGTWMTSWTLHRARRSARDGGR